MSTLGWFVIWMMAACGVKAILGVHWPWERCSCCGKKYSEHEKVSL